MSSFGLKNLNDMFTPTEKILMKFLTETMLVAETLRDDYIDTISELKGVSVEETKSRLKHVENINVEKITFRVKDYLASLPPDER